MRRLVLFFGIVAPILGWGAGTASADCITEKQTASDPYAEFEITNRCRGGAYVHWTRTSDNGSTENGKFYVSGCKIEHEQHFPGKYEFGEVEFPSGGDGETCLNPVDANKHVDAPSSREKPAPPTQRPTPPSSQSVQAPHENSGERKPKMPCPEFRQMCLGVMCDGRDRVHSHPACEYLCPVCR
jgi:hypothetical protein